MIKKYRKKPVVIEALQFDGTRQSANQVFAWLGSHSFPAQLDLGGVNGQPVKLFLLTLEGGMLVSPGDFVIRGVAGEFYPCKPEIFQQTYEAEE